MSYASTTGARRPRRFVRRGRGSARRVLGDDVDSAGNDLDSQVCNPGQVWDWGSNSCVAAATSSTPAAVPSADQANTLIQQIDRFFDPTTPTAYQLTGFNVSASGFPTNGTVDMGVAMAALTLVQKRATEAYTNAKTTVDKAGASALISQVNQGWTDPVNFVNTNIGSITATIATYADLHGIAKPASNTIAGIDTTTILIGAAVVAGLWLFGR